MTERRRGNIVEVDFGERFSPFNKGSFKHPGKIGIYSSPFWLKSVGEGEVQLTPPKEDNTALVLEVLVNFGHPEGVNANFGCEVFLSNQEYVAENSWRDDPGEGAAFFEEWRLGDRIIQIAINRENLDVLSGLQIAFIKNP